jgi:5-methylcytosine-specific restriction endonuclease McrA
METYPIFYCDEDGLYHKKCAVCDKHITHQYKSQIKQRTCSHSCQLKGNKFNLGKPGNQTAFKKGQTTGEKNVNWKGGVTPLMESIRKLSMYVEWRKAVYERDDYTCQHCSIRGAVLNADHIYLFSKIIEDHSIKSVGDAKACEKLWDVSNGQTLCKSCHNKKTTVDLVHVHKDPHRMRGLNRKGGIPGRKWKPKPTK